MEFFKRWLTEHFWSKTALTSFGTTFVAGFVFDFSIYLNQPLSTEVLKAMALGIVLAVFRAFSKAFIALVVAGLKK